VTIVGSSVREGALRGCGSVRVRWGSAGWCGAYSGACGKRSGLIIRRSQVRILEGPLKLAQFRLRDCSGIVAVRVWRQLITVGAWCARGRIARPTCSRDRHSVQTCPGAKACSRGGHVTPSRLQQVAPGEPVRPGCDERTVVVPPAPTHQVLADPLPRTPLVAGQASADFPGQRERIEHQASARRSGTTVRGSAGAAVRRVATFATASFKSRSLNTK
jgi:hypothetical protein